MAMAFLTAALAVVLLTVASSCLTITITTDAAAVCQQNQRQHDDGGGGGGGGGDLVATACEKAKGHEAHHYRGLGLSAVTKEFCEATLRSAANRSSGAAANSTQALALVAMDLAGAAAASAGTRARSALRSAGGRGGNKGERDPEYSLRYCVVDYGTVAVVLPACRAVVEEYSPGDFQAPFDYLECAGRVMDAAGDCWQRVSYDDGELKRALWDDAVAVSNLANLAQQQIIIRNSSNN